MTTKANAKTDQKTASDDKARLTVISGGGEPKPEVEAASLEPRYEVTDKGVFYINVRYDGKKYIEDEPMYLCDRIDILGRGKDEGGDYYRILRWHAAGDGYERIFALPLRDVGNRDSWGSLRAGGLALAPGRRQQDALAYWLQKHGSDEMHVVCNRGGWNFGAYVLPSGELIGEPTKPIFCIGDQGLVGAYKASGTLSDWRDSVARLCRGNSRAMLAIGTSFAATLLNFIDHESGGFHIFSSSTDGKTTVSRAAGSVWGHPIQQVLSWKTTELAVSNAAAVRNDGLVLLDEIGQNNKHEEVASVIYTLSNGTGKMQGAKEGGNRAMSRWRIMSFSTGEFDVATYMKSGNRRVMAGQEVRMASIPSDAGAGLGVFDCLNGEIDAKALGNAINDAAMTNYGTAGRCFVEYVSQHQDEIKTRLKAAIKVTADSLPREASGQVFRVASRFAIVGEALEIAADAGITGYERGEASKGVAKCLRDWIDRYGLKKREETQIIEQAESWFEANKSSPRFLDWDKTKKALATNPDADDPVTINCAGWKRRKNSGIEYLVNDVAFSEIADGFDKRYAVKVLVDSGFIKPSGQSVRQSIKTPLHRSDRLYHFVKIEIADEVS